MSNNVILLGAGFSCAAGIPLLRDFVDVMWELGIRGRFGEKQLSETDAQLFTDAAKVRRDLDGYHGRASFDDRNIEDILSILSFTALSGSETARQQLNTINQAIARTIELTCTVTHPGIPPNGQYTSIATGPALYRAFWSGIFRERATTGHFPTVITFNYDLVLERSLLQFLIGTNANWGDEPPGFHHLRVRYYHPNVPESLWRLKGANFSNRDHKYILGTILEHSGVDSSDSMAEIELLKLHGSLNFPRTARPSLDKYNIVEPLTDPQILPPIFNKLTSNTPTEMWKIALQRLGKAKNVVVLGYSLPTTDIYMQYFLKAALGPNQDLNRIHVCDPVAKDGPAGEPFKDRYRSCFAPQLRPRIAFYDMNADAAVTELNRNPGTFLF